MLELALLARAAADAGRTASAGRLWGAIEAEEARGSLGFWDREREAHAAPVLAHAGADFEAGRADGRRLPLDDAVEYALGLRE